MSCDLPEKSPNRSGSEDPAKEETSRVAVNLKVTDDERAFVRSIFTWNRLHTSLTNHFMRTKLPCGLLVEIIRRGCERENEDGTSVPGVVIQISFVDSSDSRHRVETCYSTKAARGVFLDNIVAEVKFYASEVVDLSRPKPDVVRDPLPDVVVFKVMHCLEEVHDLRLCACHQFFYRSPAKKCTGCIMSRLVGDSQCGVCYEKTAHSTPCCNQTLCSVCDANVDACPFCRREHQYHYHGAAEDEEFFETIPVSIDSVTEATAA